MDKESQLIYAEEMVRNSGSEEQKKRMAKAASAECTPVSIDAESGTGFFSGSSGKYQTRLDGCDCMDFRRRRMPCKHMYRLAAELGLVDIGEYEKDKGKIKVSSKEKNEIFEEIMDHMRDYSPDLLKEIKELILDQEYRQSIRLYDNVSIFDQAIEDGILEKIPKSDLEIMSHFSQKRTIEGLESVGFKFPDDIKPTKKSKYEWCKNNADIVVNMIYKDCGSVRLTERTKIVWRKIYSFLSSLFPREIDYYEP